MRVNPATSGDRFSTPCTYIGRNAVSPITTIPLSRVAALAVAIGRNDHSRNATIGFAARRSCHTNKAVAAANTANAARVDCRWPVPTCVSPSIREAIARVNSTAPGTSTRACSVDTFSRRNAANPAIESRPTGRLIQKIQAQDRCWMISPPASGPSTEDRPQTLASQPCTLPRSCTG